MWIREGLGGSGRVREGPKGLGGSERILKGPWGSGRVWEDQGGSCRFGEGLGGSGRALLGLGCFDRVQEVLNRHDGSTLVCRGSLRVRVGIRLFGRVRGSRGGSCRYSGKFMKICECL